MNAELSDLRKQVNALKWFHQIDFGNGIVSPGQGSLETLNAQAEIYFADGIRGKTFLDVGCWDGFNSIEAVKRGASRVLATDYWVWNNIPGVSQATIKLARDHLAPALEIMEIDTADLSVERVGQFDWVLMAGVFYHLPNPFLTMAAVAKLAREMLIIETHMDAADVDRPAMIFYPGKELNEDYSNWWGPNRACVEGMLRNVGFPNIRYDQHPIIPTRGIFRAMR